ncbi:M20/M25/M40 family metallo-hydrolase [Streptomyces paludis]|uniref:M20/M25/M40 family metallo-hydrolase n=1 Tax=Streptomyces paludis TaxID=2282738 RepID=A0A345HQW1_9ACTN|nr:M20/M25/M40 family metallo-hydrolase [Streptomyces paludis]
MAVAAATALAAPLLLSASSPAVAGSKAGTKAGSQHSAASRHNPAKEGAKLAKELVRDSSAKDAYKHLQKFQVIAEANGGHRAAGTPGHDKSASYVHDLLKKAGYRVSYQDFEITYIETLAEKLAVTSPAPRDIGIHAMSYTRSTPVGGITAEIAAVPVSAATGCAAGDYAAGAYTGKIALIQRGGCTFAQKQQEAGAAGAVGAIIYNNTTGTLSGTLGDPDVGVIPTGGISQADGQALAADVAGGPVSVSFDIRQLQEQRTTRNVIAETKGGRSDRTVMLGSHLDSVTEGPGINDNGSGSAGLLDVALKLARTHEKPTNKVRFAWWSAEELGLLGSEHYVAELTDKQRADLALYLNFDMIASPNYAQFVYDGDGSDSEAAEPGPEGSAQIEKAIQKYLDSKRIPHEGSEFNGRSDYGPFIEVGIPAGGTFTGAEGIKTAAQERRYGGEAGVAYDKCYHSACDDLSNISMKAFGVNIGVIANAVGTYAHDVSTVKKPAVAPKGLKSATKAQDHDHEHEPKA